MHSRIIQISDHPVTADERLTESALYEDTTVQSCTDYFGSIISGEDERDDFLRFTRCFKDFIASSDYQTRHIRLVPLEERRRLVREWIREGAETMLSSVNDLERFVCPMFHYEALMLLTEYHHVSYLIHNGHYAVRSGEFVADLLEWPDDIYIGTIMDYHF